MYIIWYTKPHRCLQKFDVKFSQNKILERKTPFVILWFKSSICILSIWFCTKSFVVMSADIPQNDCLVYIWLDYTKKYISNVFWSKSGFKEQVQTAIYFFSILEKSFHTSKKPLVACNAVRGTFPSTKIIQNMTPASAKNYQRFWQDAVEIIDSICEVEIIIHINPTTTLPI